MQRQNQNPEALLSLKPPLRTDQQSTRDSWKPCSPYVLSRRSNRFDNALETHDEKTVVVLMVGEMEGWANTVKLIVADSESVLAIITDDNLHSFKRSR